MDLGDQVRHADERMKKFFNKLIDLKKYVKEEADKTKDKTLSNIFNKLDELIKEKQ